MLGPEERARALAVAEALARGAGAIVRGHFVAGRRASTSKPDGSPVTAADAEANAHLTAGLERAFPDDAVLSEERADDRARLGRRRVWIVDPLDGTRDFVAGSPEFAVHVALVVDGTPEIGVVHLPVADRLYRAVRGAGSQCVEAGGIRSLRVATIQREGRLRVGITARASHPGLLAFLSRTGAEGVPLGASTKAMELAEGRLHACVWLHDRESEWDSCAPGLVVTEAGGSVRDVDGEPLRYNRPDVRHRRGLVLTATGEDVALLAAARACFEESCVPS